MLKALSQSEKKVAWCYLQNMIVHFIFIVCRSLQCAYFCSLKNIYLENNYFINLWSTSGLFLVCTHYRKVKQHN